MMKTYCAICEERIEYDSQEYYERYPFDIGDFIASGKVTGHQENGRDYCAKCWGLR